MKENVITVLVAEDLKILRENLVEMLNREEDIEVVGSAASGKEAIRLARLLSPQIILMDIEMESKDAGVIAANVICHEAPETKIIFLTLHEEEQIIIEALSSGAVDYIFKTADCKNAIAHIRQAHQDRIKLEGAVERVMHSEYLRVLKSKQQYMEFIRKVMVLTPSEREIIRLLLNGYKVAEIADKRCVEPITTKKQIGQILKKLKARRTKDVVKIIEEMHIESLFWEEG